MLNLRRRLIYPITWLASKLMITDGSSPISSLVPDCNLPKAATLVLADGTLVPVLPPRLASTRGNPKRHYRHSHKSEASHEAEGYCCNPAWRCSVVPGGPWRGTRFPQNEITKLTTVQHLNVQRCSFTHYSPVVTPKTLPSAGRSTKRDTHHNSTPPHKGAAVHKCKTRPSNK